jgi:hypothetical protein
MPPSICPWKKSECVLADHEVLTRISLIVGDPQGILDQQLRPCEIHILNTIIIIIVIVINNIKILKKFKILKRLLMAVEDCL